MVRTIDKHCIIGAIFMYSLFYIIAAIFVFTKPLQAQTPIRFLFMTESHTALALYFDQINSESIVILINIVSHVTGRLRGNIAV